MSLQHKTLNSTLTGVQSETLTQFRGIPYGQVPRRFALAEQVDLPASLDCTKFGPRCPQPFVDPGHLLRVPTDHHFPLESEDEFKCTNLDVVVPRVGLEPASQGLPVLVWIHGGSQAVTFGSTPSGICNMTQIVTDSVDSQKPIIIVSVQYRLNIFAFGGGDGNINMALRDQALALDWVQEHIAGFGGDPARVTLAGESAGSVYCHAHIVRNAPVRQCILSSGTLHLSPPQPSQNATLVRKNVSECLEAIDKNSNLQTASVSQMIKAIEMTGIQNWFLEEHESLNDWQNKIGQAERLMLSDLEQEAVIWRAATWQTNVVDIVSAFTRATCHGDELKKIYHIYPDRPTSCRTGALDFITDYKFVLPIETVTRLWKASQRPVYRYLVDEKNPWQPSSGAHHGLDLVLLFGGLDMSCSTTAEQTGRRMRAAWIRFINGNEPWASASDSPHVFGPHGISQNLDQHSLRSHRRMNNVVSLESMDKAELDALFIALAARKVSLIN